MGELAGKVALVTGASQGIGQGIALRLAVDGATVGVNHPGPEHSPQDTLQLIDAGGGRAFSVSADVSDRQQVEAMIENVVARAGRLDILVNNAGICPLVEFHDATEDIFDRTVAVNLKGTWLCSQSAASQMLHRGEGGRIVAISSINSIIGGSLQSHYGPTKAGQRALMNHLAVVLGPHGITCNSVLPGTIRTPLNEEFLADPNIMEQYSSRIPVRRLGHPADIASAVAFLARDDASYVNGAEILVDGGAIVNFS